MNWTKNKIAVVLFFLLYSFLPVIFWDVINFNGYQISIFLILGFGIVILALLGFVFLKNKKDLVITYQIHTFSENKFKIIIIILMCFSIFIPSANSVKTIILWESLSFLNFFRAVIFIVGCAYLPGANFYSIFFSKSNLHERFKVEPFFLKITLYPIVSFGIIGMSVLVLDQLGLTGDLISFGLFVIILYLFIFDFLLQNSRGEFAKVKEKRLRVSNKEKTLRISKHTLNILLLAFGIATISIGFQIGWKYLIAGDPWHAIKYANYIGKPGTSPIYNYPYPNFWGYISYGLSVLSGLPYININTLLAPFSYLFITSIYLFTKSILNKFKTKYSVLATILIAIFSGLFADPIIPSLIFVGDFYFIFKSYSYILFFISTALFFTITNNNSIRETGSSRFLKIGDSKFVFLSAWFLILSFMTYVFPFFLAFLFLFIYCVFSGKNKKSRSFKYLLYFTICAVSIFIIFDTILEFFLSHLLKHYVLIFFSNHPITNVTKYIPPPLFIYPLYFLLIFTLLIINMKIYYNFRLNNQLLHKLKSNRYKIFKILLYIFIFCLCVELFLFIMNLIIPTFDISKNFFLFSYFDVIFLNFGFIGIIGIYLSIYIYKKYSRLYLLLFSWIIISILFASLVLYIEWVINLKFTSNIFLENSNTIKWFNEIWIFSIPPLCILASVGIYELVNKMKKYEFFRKNKKLSIPIIKILFTFSLLSFSFSGVMISGVIYGNANYRYNDSRIETLGWISENIPIYSGILVIDNFFMGGGIHSITFVEQFFFHDIFDEEFNETLYLQQITILKLRNIQYVEVSQIYLSYFPEISNFVHYILLPQFFNVKIYQNGEIAVYYAEKGLQFPFYLNGILTE